MSKLKPQTETAATNGHAQRFEYKTVTLASRADVVLNEHASRGWECFAITSGGFDDATHRWCPCSTALYFRRPLSVRKSTEELAAVAD